MDYIYLRNQKRARSLALVLSMLSLLLTVINVVLLLTGSKWSLFIRCSLTFNILSLIALLLFCMHYMWANALSRSLNIIMHLQQLHLIFTVFAMFVGEFNSFSYTLIHGILEAIIFSLIYALISKKQNIIVIFFISLVTMFVSLLQLYRVISIIEIIGGILLIICSLTDMQDLNFIYKLLFGLTVTVISLLSLINSFDFYHVILHYIIDNITLALTAIVCKNVTEVKQ
ncbi:MAG: hypothetical protein Q4C64_04900 [Erysipelotrichia bacterium]|nr:hypothetical protein [Erysipelotrichia bacterium]